MRKLPGKTPRKHEENHLQEKVWDTTFAGCLFDCEQRIDTEVKRSGYLIKVRGKVNFLEFDTWTGILIS